MAHMLLSSIVHGLIYALIYKVFRHIGVGGTAVAAIAAIAASALVFRFTQRRRIHRQGARR